MDSKDGLIYYDGSHENFIVTHGSGADVLDSVLRERFIPRLKELQEFLVTIKEVPVQFVRQIAPYFICLWLSEMSLSAEVSTLEKYGVGGAFHFIFQTPDGEAPQSPAIYIFCSRHEASKTVYGWVYKVAHVEGGLYVQAHSPKETSKTNYLVDTASRRDLASLSKEEICESMDREVERLPFFQFCGCGFTEPQHRNSFWFIHKLDGKKEDLFDDHGGLQKEVAESILSNFE